MVLPWLPGRNPTSVGNSHVGSCPLHRETRMNVRDKVAADDTYGGVDVLASST
jgi:hypothetical protein